MTQRDTLDKLVTAIQEERERRGGEGRRVFLDFDASTELRYDLTAREASGFLRSKANVEALQRRLGAESVKYHPTKYHKASGGTERQVGFVQYRVSPGRRDPTSVQVKFGEGAGVADLPRTHATKKSAAQLDREIAAAIAGRAAPNDDEGIFFLTDTHERPLGQEFASRAAAKRAAMKLVRAGTHPRVEVWHRWRGDRYMQGLASDEGWSDV